MKKLCIFDLDGTLVNSVYDLADAMNAVLENNGCPVHDVEKYKYFVGNGTLKLVERAVPESERSPERVAELHKQFAAEYEKRLVNKTRAYDGIKELLTELKARGVLLAVASNKPHPFTVEVVEGVFGKGVFDLISGKKEGVPTKPSPEIMLDIMAKLGAAAEGCIHSGDSAVDVNTAHNSGVKCIGCTWGFRTREELEGAGADFIAEGPEDIFTLCSEFFGFDN